MIPYQRTGTNLAIAGANRKQGDQRIGISVAGFRMQEIRKAVIWPAVAGAAGTVDCRSNQRVGRPATWHAKRRRRENKTATIEYGRSEKNLLDQSKDIPHWIGMWQDG